MRLNKYNFKELAKEVHGNKYNYSKSVYTNNRTPLTITCSTHGDFMQRPVDHIHQKSQCPKCRNAATADLNRVPKEEFIKRSEKHHGNKYNYSLVIYKQLKEKVTIVCPEHGEFKQQAHLHSIGHGCPKCANRGFNKMIPGTLYYIKITYKGKNYYKIGITNRSVIDRFKAENSISIETVFTVNFSLGFDAFLAEQHIIRDNISMLYKGESFMKTNKNDELFVTDVLQCPKNAQGKLTKPDNFDELYIPEPKLQQILDER